MKIEFWLFMENWDLVGMSYLDKLWLLLPTSSCYIKLTWLCCLHHLIGLCGIWMYNPILVLPCIFHVGKA